MTVIISDERDLKTIESALLEARARTEAEYYRYLVSGHILNNEEKQRLTKLDGCLRYIKQALRSLEAK